MCLFSNKHYISSMKKIIIIGLIFMISIVSGGCMNRGKQLTNELGSEQKMADNVIEELSIALDAKDAEALKKMFSEKTKKEAKNLDQQILDMVDFYEGETTSFEGHISSSNTTEKGINVEKEIKGMYRLNTDGENYRVFFEYKPISVDNPDEIGLSSIELITETAYQIAVDTEGAYDWQTGTKGSGVYMMK